MDFGSKPLLNWFERITVPVLLQDEVEEDKEDNESSDDNIDEDSGSDNDTLSDEDEL